MGAIKRLVVGSSGARLFTLLNDHMKQTLASAVVTLIVTLLLTSPVTLIAQNERMDNRVASLEIRLCDADGKVVSMVKTKEDGSFSFRCPSEGEYSLVVTNKAMESARVAINTKGTGADKGRTATRATATFTDGTTENVTSSRTASSDQKSVDFFLDIDDDCDGITAIVSPRDAASGLPTGKRQHKPVTIVKELDKSTPLLMCSKSGSVVRGHVGYDVKSNTK